MKFRFPVSFFCIMLTCAASAQTSVKGGIVTNTLWTKANSPYIVDSNVVVFAGDTLSIEPGVTVKFADQQGIEIKDGVILANGTSSEPIIFTSNSSSPVPGIFSGIDLSSGVLVSQFNYCSFSYADHAIQTNHVNDTLTITHSDFISTNNGVFSPYAKVIIDSCNFFTNSTGLTGGGEISNCVFSKNQTAISESGQFSVVKNCTVRSNQTGITQTAGKIINTTIAHNETGIELGYNTVVDNCIVSSNDIGMTTLFNTCPPMWDSVKNSTIDSNDVKGFEINMTSYIYNCKIRNNELGIDLANGDYGYISKNYIEDNRVGIQLAVPTVSIRCNRICGNSMYNIQSLLPPGNFHMYNNYWCTTNTSAIDSSIYDAKNDPAKGHVFYLPLDSTCYLLNGTGVNEIPSVQFKLYPNPANGKFTVELQSSEKTNEAVEIYNLMGEKIYSEILNPGEHSSTIDVSMQPDGIYFIRIGGRSTQKIIISR